MSYLPETEEILRADLDRATQQHEAAKLEFWRVCADIPSALPHPDGTQRIQNAARAKAATMEAVVLALRRFNAFLVHGLVPDDLRHK
jgi:hypothetical protein